MHTSDWHLGRTFHGFSLHSVTETLLEELIETIQEQNIDVLLISGDIYDQAQPRVDTVRLLSRTFQKLIALGVTVVATSGNHDSAARLGFASEILASGGLHLITSPEQVDQPVLIEKGGVKAAIYGFPYLEPHGIASQWGVEASHPAVLAEAGRRALTNYTQQEAHAAIALSHCFVSGATTSDSERDITVGGLASLGADTFTGFDYVALGHIHGKQTITDTVRYSGSLLAFSFSEEKHTKGGWILDVEPTGISQITAIEWQTTIKLRTLKGKLEHLLTSPEYEGLDEHFLRIYITDNERPYAAADQLKTRFNHIAELYFTPENPQPGLISSYSRERFETKSTQEITEDFFAHVRQRRVTEEEALIVQEATETAGKDN